MDIKKASSLAVFSYRFKPQKGYIFDPKCNITSFKKHASEKIKQKGVKGLVVCGISGGVTATFPLLCSATGRIVNVGNYRRADGLS